MNKPKPKLSIPMRTDDSCSSAGSSSLATPPVAGGGEGATRRSPRPALKLAPVRGQPAAPPPTQYPTSSSTSSTSSSEARLANIHEALSLLSIVNHDQQQVIDNYDSITTNSSSNASHNDSSKKPPPSPRPQHSRSSSQPLCEKDLVDLGRLGEGASGEVRKVRHTPTGIIMAKKTIDTSPNPDIHKQILRELSFNRSCNASFIVKYYGAFLEDVDSRIVICMEYCEGRSLDAILKQVHRRGGVIGEKVLGKMAEAVLSGLVYLHDHKIIHRDIKPSNILVSRDGLFKICDFGVSGELINSFAGTFTGNSMYMAPERIQGSKYTITSDIWSLGLTIYEAAMNEFPVPKELASAPIELLMYIVKMDPPQLVDDPESGLRWTRAFRDFIRACLEKDPQVRPTPQVMLTHPWIKKSEQRTTDIAGWIAMVWGWK